MSENYENERLVLFSDAVIAITITLMVLEIRLPGDAAEMADGALWTALGELWPRYLSYVLSFLVIGMIWAGHRRKFESIRRSSDRLIWINLLFLLSLGFMPFVTDLLAENGGMVATMVYAGVVAVVSLMSAAISLYAARAGLTDGAMPAWRMALPSFATATVFALSIPVAWLDDDAGKYFWLALIPVNMVVGRILRQPTVPPARP
jgi:uncharacterized membrane protein